MKKIEIPENAAYFTVEVSKGETHSPSLGTGGSNDRASKSEYTVTSYIFFDSEDNKLETEYRANLVSMYFAT